jgi:hypothetical protein
LEILSQLVVDLMTILDCDEGVDGLSGEFVGNTNHSSFRDGLILNQRSFDFGCGETVTGNVDDIIDTTSDPVVAFVVTSCSIAGELGVVSG